MSKKSSPIQLGRVSPDLHAKIVAEQQRIKKMTSIEPSLNEVVRVLIERGLRLGQKA